MSEATRRIQLSPEAYEIGRKAMRAESDLHLQMLHTMHVAHRLGYTEHGPGFFAEPGFLVTDLHDCMKELKAEVLKTSEAPVELLAEMAGVELRRGVLRGLLAARDQLQGKEETR